MPGDRKSYSPAGPGFDLYTVECTKCAHVSRYNVEYHTSKCGMLVF